MSYCINPKCSNRCNLDELEYCQTCGTRLLINNRYRLIKPLRQLSQEYVTEIFEVDDRGQIKVLKSLIKQRIKLVELFKQEVKILTYLRHPGIPKVEPNEHFTIVLNGEQELHCLVMERIKGQNLEQWLDENDLEPISEDVALNWLKQLADILSYVHQNGFFHRDIKPSNIIQKHNRQLALIDFGTAREVTDTVINGRTITTIYSHGFTPPEQIEGRAVPQSDFFALGRTLVHLLTSQRPTSFYQDSQSGKLMWRDNAPQISKSLADFIDRLMDLSLEKRPQDAQEILRITEQIILQLSLQRLKEIDAVTQIPSLTEKPKHDNTEPLFNLILSPEKYSQLEEILAEIIGPIAPTLLQKSSNQLRNPMRLIDDLLQYIPPHQQVEFEKQAFLLLQKLNMSQPKLASLPSSKNQAINEKFVRECEKELTDLVGPVASFLIEKILKSSPQISRSELLKALAAEIPDSQKAGEFQQRLAI